MAGEEAPLNLVKNPISSSNDEGKYLIMHNVDAQVRKKLAMKSGKRKKLKAFIERLVNRVHRGFLCRTRIHVRQYDGTSCLGYDQFGRDVAHGVSKYIELLKSRGLHLDTVIVLGSRAKGFWKPSSDVDVTIIGSNIPRQREGFLANKILGLKSSRLLSDRPLCLGIEPSGCCSKQEFLRRMEKFDIQALDAIYYGIVFYDDGFWLETKRKFHEIEKMYGLNEAEIKEKLLFV